MNRHYREELKAPYLLSAGWLFADMLLALAMLFLAANTVSIKPPALLPTVTPTHVPVKSTPMPLPRLELLYHEFQLNIDPDGLLNDSQSAKNRIIQQVKAQSFLRGRSAGLVIVYGGALNDTQIPSAQSVSNKIYVVLANLGKQGYVFNRASYYNPLYLLGGSRNIAVVDVYLFAR